MRSRPLPQPTCAVAGVSRHLLAATAAMITAGNCCLWPSHIRKVISAVPGCTTCESIWCILLLQPSSGHMTPMRHRQSAGSHLQAGTCS